jgi:hypothetical protein
MKTTAPRVRVNPIPLSVLAGGFLAWAAVLVVIAVLGRDRIVPDFFDDLRLEHFIAFYVIAFLAAAGLPGLTLRWLLLGLLALAGGVEAVRAALGHGWTRAGLDFACNLAGVLAALAPITLARHRDAFLAHTAGPPGEPADKPVRPPRAR